MGIEDFCNTVTFLVKILECIQERKGGPLNKKNFEATLLRFITSDNTLCRLIYIIFILAFSLGFFKKK